MSKGKANNQMGRPTLLDLLNRTMLRAVLTAVLLVGISNVVIAVVLVRMQMDRNLDLLGRAAADTVEAAVVFDDREAANEALTKVGAGNNLAAIRLVSPAGEELAAWIRPGGGGSWSERLVELILEQPHRVSVVRGGTEIAEVRLWGYGEPLLRFLLVSLLVGVLAFAASALVAYRMSLRAGRKIVRPLEELAQVAHAARAERQFDRRIPPASIEELHSLGDDFNALLAELQSWQEQVTLENEQLTYQANHDPLTGLQNRQFFEKKLAARIEHARMAGERLAVFFMDGDKFKEVNDELGHEVGDQVLQGIAGRLRAALRETDTVARLGGDEFAVLLSPVRENEHAIHVAHNILSRLEAPLPLPAGCLRKAGLSIGIAFFPDHAGDAADLLKSADMAMYRAKKTNPGSYVIADLPQGHP
jgi:diguanylate cyclase